MRKIFKSVACCAVLVAVMASCNNHSDDVYYMLPETRNIQLTDEQRIIRDNNNEFAWKLFKAVQEQEGDGSIVMSPMSVTYVLGMLNAGAAGTTREQITAMMGLGNDPAAINAFCKQMIDGAPNVDPAATLKVANRIDVNSAKGLGLLKQYVNDMKQYYSAQVESMDFTKGGALDKINSWCKKNTSGMIPSILDEINPDAAMYLLNAIYFSADWSEKFDKNDTRKADFTLLDGTTVKRDLMHRKAVALSCESELCDMLCLPFGSGGYRMYFMLPAPGVSLKALVDDINANGLNDYFNAMQMSAQEVDILVPGFETASEMDLNEPLKSLGMVDAFTANANFSNMCDKSLFVSYIKQRAKILVNEDGAKATAVTIAEMGCTSPGPVEYQKADFHATRPFLYFIMEASTRSIFFIGTYCGE